MIKIYTIIICFLFIIIDIKALQEKSTLAGTITELKSGEYAIGITINLIDIDTSTNKIIKYGAYTNKFGFYSIPEIEPGEYYIYIRSIGYKNYLEKIKINPGQQIIKNIELIISDFTTEEIIIEAEKEKKPTERIGMVKIEPTFIENMPFLFENDVFRSLQLLPGIQQSNELSSGLYIRGGSPDQNLILLDNVIVYNPSHLGGFLSTFNSDALRDIKVIKGAFPAEYGGRLSSVIDMTMKEGTKEKISGEGALSIVSSKITLEGPINNDATFMVSARRMYLDLLTKALIPSDEEVPIYYFYDLNAKVNYKISENNRVFLSGFFGRDVLASNDNQDKNFEIFWGNKTGNLRWMHIVSPTLFTNFSLIYTDYNFNTLFTEDYDNENSSKIKITSGIQDITLRANAEYFPNTVHTVKTGFETTWHTFNSGIYTDFNDIDNNIFPKETIKSFDAALYIQDEWQITPLISSNIGARLYYFENGNYLNLEPRISLAYQLTDNIILNAAFAVANQYLHLIVRNDITLPTDLWFPSTKNILPSRSMQGSIGFETNLLNNQYLLTTEFYYKDMNNIYEYKEDAIFTLGIPLEDQFTSGRGEAFGMEIFLNKKIGSFTGWIGYTLSWTKRYFDKINNGKWFYPRYDRRHDISVVLNYKLFEHWDLSLTWVYGTGQAYTMPTGQYIGLNNDNYYSNEIKYQFTNRNGFRLPPYHRMDLNLIYKYKWFNLPFKFYISIYNLYNRKNPFAWYIANQFNYNLQESTKVVKQITLFPIIPNFGLSFSF